MLVEFLLYTIYFYIFFKLFDARYLSLESFENNLFTFTS